MLAERHGKLDTGPLDEPTNLTTMVTMNYSVASAKAKLSELIRAALADEEVIITDHGRPVARLIPCAVQEDTLDARFASFNQRGRLQRAEGRPGDPWPPASKGQGVKGALARFLAERASG